MVGEEGSKWQYLGGVGCIDCVGVSDGGCLGCGDWLCWLRWRKVQVEGEGRGWPESTWVELVV